MEKEADTNCLDEREEGEIIEDEFEDVSDCSMSISPIDSPLPPGKLLAPPEFLPAVSLSSVSDDEVRLVPVYNRCATKRRRHSKSPHSNHKRKRQTRSHSRKSKAYVDYHSDCEAGRLERKRILLNKALRRESQEELLHNSLRSRLKSMLYDNIEQPSSDEDLEELREIALLSRNTEVVDKKSTRSNLENEIRNDLNSVIEKDLKNDSDSVIIINETEDSENNSENRDSAHNSDAAEDSELINLRLEALKSAVIKKSRERKKRKVIEHEKKIVSQETLVVPDDVAEFDEIDKENSFNSKDSSSKPRKCSESEKVLNESNPIINCATKGSTIFPKNDLIENHEENIVTVDLNLLKMEINSQNPVTENFNDKSPEKNVLEEDADILRAMLLASMSRKITSKNTNVIPKGETTSVPSSNSTLQILPPKEANHTVKQQTLSTFNPRIAIKTVTSKSLGKSDLNSINKAARVNTTKKIHYSVKSHKWEKLSNNIEVKPIIIKVNCSDSDDDEFESQATNNNLKETVEMFLKKQRAEVEAKITVAADNKQTDTANNGKNVSVDVINKPNASEKISNVLTKNGKLNPLINSNRMLKKNDNREILDKSINELLLNRSALKLLPKSQQIEYQKLKQQLLNAKKEIKLKKAVKIQPFSKNDAKLGFANFTKISKPLPLNLKLYNYQKCPKPKLVPKQSIVTEEKALEAVTNLKKILDDIQVQQNGRLQMKGKYQLLVPLLRKINQASNERRQNEGEIKRLLSELQQARAKLANSHQHFISLVQQLVVGKESLDKRFIIETKPFKETKIEMCTSTPVKKKGDVKACDDGTVWNVTTENLNIDVKKDVLNESQTSSALTKKDLINSSNLILDVEHTQSDIGCENNTKCEENQFDNSYVHISKCLENVNIVDPNDIEKSFIEQESDDKQFTDYVSPLGSYDREKVDPLKALCPYDLFGVCRDKECPYSHCS